MRVRVVAVSSAFFAHLLVESALLEHTLLERAHHVESGQVRLVEEGDFDAGAPARRILQVVGS